MARDWLHLSVNKYILLAKFIALPAIINTCVVARLCTDFEIDGKVIESYMTADMTISCLDAEYKDLSLIHISEPTRPY